jgi:hypothetical protein
VRCALDQKAQKPRKAVKKTVRTRYATRPSGRYMGVKRILKKQNTQQRPVKQPEMNVLKVYVIPITEMVQIYQFPIFF